MVSAVTVPGADTPLFYLVATGPDSAGVNFLVRPILYLSPQNTNGSIAGILVNPTVLLLTLSKRAPEHALPMGNSSNPENSQLGAKVTFNWVGGFYVCGTNKEVYYKVNSADGPTGCTPIDLYTLPVVQ
ncbi:hypothetical protein H1R20_g7183, partial [Candolleomyces eurysporus]